MASRRLLAQSTQLHQVLERARDVVLEQRVEGLLHVGVLAAVREPEGLDREQAWVQPAMEDALVVENGDDGPDSITVRYSDGYELSVPGRSRATNRDIGATVSLMVSDSLVPVGASVELRAEVSEDVTKVEFYQDGALIGTALMKSRRSAGVSSGSGSGLRVRISFSSSVRSPVPTKR